MKNSETSPTAEKLDERMLRAWNGFWYASADPTVLGLIRLCCGLITLYTVMAYSFNLDDFFGKHAWLGLEDVRRVIDEKPYTIGPLRGFEVGPAPVGEYQTAHVNEFRARFPGVPVPWPYPSNPQELKFAQDFEKHYHVDFRIFHVPFPQNADQEDYLHRYMRERKQPPPPPYPKDAEEEDWIDEYIRHHELDPRLAYHRGKTIWSLWYHITDPFWMRVVHTLIVMVTFLFTIGCGTRITSVLTWIGNLCYIHRSEITLFGVDTMMTILLLYLMIGPSGAAVSVDRLIAKWWSENRARVIARWRNFWGRPAIDIANGPAPSEPPEPSISANFAIRLLQVHVCIIYLAAGLSKLLGNAWWNGTAVWNVIANYEFAPMQFEIYNSFLRLLGQNQLVFAIFLTSACYFTLFFEIAYCFLIWRPATRWLILGMAIILHALIGLFMGLKTFSMMMLVMNMAFLKPEEARWLIRKGAGFGNWLWPPPDKAPEKSTAITAGHGS